MEIGLLALINQWLGFFSVRSKIRGRVYTIIGTLANFYLLYVAIRLISNGRLRGWLILAVFLLLLYFSILNLIYYFTDKTVAWDISPWIDRLLGGQDRSEENKTVTMPANGLYSRDQVLSAVISIDQYQAENLNNIYHRLNDAGLISDNYNSLSKSEIRRYLESHQTMPANFPGTLLPFFDLKYSPAGLIIYGGVNQMNSYPIGLITKVGLQDAIVALQEYRLSLASVVLLSPENYTLDPQNHRLKEIVLPCSLQAEVAYKRRTDPVK